MVKASSCCRNQKAKAVMEGSKWQSTGPGIATQTSAYDL